MNLSLILLMAKVKFTNLVYLNASDIHNFLNSGTASDKTITDGNGNKKVGALSNLSDQVESLGAGTYNITRKIFIYVAAIALIAAAIGFVVNGRNVNKRAEDKSSIVWIIFAIIFGFAAAGLLIFAANIGEGLLPS